MCVQQGTTTTRKSVCNRLGTVGGKGASLFPSLPWKRSKQRLQSKDNGMARVVVFALQSLVRLHAGHHDPLIYNIYTQIRAQGRTRARLAVAS